MKNKKIISVRKKLDKLDLKMLSIIKKRSLLVNKILDQKKYKNQIIDKQRINIILRKIKNESKKKNIDPKITNTIWKSMIRAFINYEFKKFKKKISYLLCGGSFFSTKNSCFLVLGLYFFNFNLSFAFSPLVGFLA